MKMMINIGSSVSNAEGWINLDNALRHIIISRIRGLPYLLYKAGLISKQMYDSHKNGNWKRVRYGDARKKLPFKSDSIDYIYTSHMLEHLFFEEAISFLNECLRILKPNGLIRIAIPDLEGAARDYINAIDELKGSVEATENFVHLFFDKKKRQFLAYGHRYMYDKVTLLKYLSDVGFIDINICDFRQGRCPDLELIENRVNSLFVEASKPQNPW